MDIAGRSRVTGIRVGEVVIDTINRGADPIKGTFALVRDDGALVGRYTKSVDWSQKTMDLLDQLTLSMELDAAQELFDLTPGDRGEDSNEPPQV